MVVQDQIHFLSLCRSGGKHPSPPPTPWAEDLGCVIWDILSQTGSANVREELEVSQTKQMAAAEDPGGADSLLGASSFQVEDVRGPGSGGFWEQREFM